MRLTHKDGSTCPERLYLATTALRPRVPIPGSIETAAGTEAGTEVDAAGPAATVAVIEAVTVVAAAGSAAGVAVQAETVDPAAQGVLEVRATDVSKVATGSQTKIISRFDSPVLLWEVGAASFSKICLRAIIKDGSARFLGFG